MQRLLLNLLSERSLKLRYPKIKQFQHCVNVCHPQNGWPFFLDVYRYKTGADGFPSPEKNSMSGGFWDPRILGQHVAFFTGESRSSSSRISLGAHLEHYFFRLVLLVWISSFTPLSPLLAPLPCPSSAPPHAPITYVPNAWNLLIAQLYFFFAAFARLTYESPHANYRP